MKNKQKNLEIVQVLMDTNLEMQKAISKWERHIFDIVGTLKKYLPALGNPKENNKRYMEYHKR